MSAHVMSEAQKFIFISKYSRWIESKSRREIGWAEETAPRYFNFLWNHEHGAPGSKIKAPLGDLVPRAVRKLCEEKVAALEVAPSMRAAWAAGDVLEENNTLAYNCCYVPFVDLRAPVEMFFILMCGTGVGFSTEHEYIDQMPAVAKWNGDGVGVHVVGDSREGWADSLKAGFDAWFAGKDIEFDYSKVRPRGARLKRMGGRASGPGPLRRLHKFCRKIIAGAAERKLTSVEWLDIGNMIGDVVVVGGVRRSSEINFSDLSDQGIAHAKDGGNFYADNPQRAMSNNSAVYFKKPDAVTFMREWTTLAASGRGERGIYNVGGIKALYERKGSRRKFTWHFRANPCGEIILRPFQFCNLTEIVVRATDTFDDLVQKVKVAVWLGAAQACLTKFPYIRDEFRKNCEEERLLGVSLTGQMDNPILLSAERLGDLKAFAVKTCKRACEAFAINMSVAITTGKPSGTVSQLVNAASGMHARHSRFYLRRFRLASVDPLFRLMRDQGVDFTPENGQRPEDVEEKRVKLRAEGHDEQAVSILAPDWTEDGVQTWVCAFPEKAPEGCVTRNDLTAIQQLEWYLKLQKNWCEHNQSATIYVRDEEWPAVGAWVFKHFDEIVGVSFLPHDGGHYQQPPYEEITEDEYTKFRRDFPKLDYSVIGKYEMEDNTTGAQNLACTAGVCELI